MKELLEFLVENITGTKDYTIEEAAQDGHTNLLVKVNPEFVGLVIGKGGKTIKTIRNILKVKAVLEKKTFSVNVEASE